MRAPSPGHWSSTGKITALFQVLVIDPPIQGTNTSALRTPGLLSRLNLPLNFTSIASLNYAILYPIISPNIVGFTLGPLILGGAALANRLVPNYDRTKVSSSSVLISLLPL